MERPPTPEHLDPAPAPAGLRILQPLRIRDFRLLFAGVGTSLLGDGVYTVTIAWQVYELSNAPTALSVVGLAWTLPMILFLLGALGGEGGAAAVVRPRCRQGRESRDNRAIPD